MTAQTSEVTKTVTTPITQSQPQPQPAKKDSRIIRIVKIALTALLYALPIVLAVGGFNFLAIRAIVPLFTNAILHNGVRAAVAAICTGVTLLVNGAALRALYRVAHNGFNMFASRHAVRVL